MTTKQKVALRKRPEANLADVVMKEFAAKSPIRKSFVSMKAAEGETGSSAGIFTPDDEQLAKINQYTRSEKSADEVVAFRTLSCNDAYDRDDDGFRRGAISQMQALEPPYSFVGKSFMVGHDYTKLPVGRIFDEGAETIEGINFLTHDVFLPNIDANQTFIENMDFGVYWAVSVGLVLESTACTICDNEMYSWYCKMGHEKGLYYDPTSDEVDSWGWPEPVEATAKGAVKCQRDMYDPSDGYELSMVFLGAQYGAELAKRPDFKGVIKAAGLSDLPTIGLSTKEADELPIPHEDEVITEARAKYSVTQNDDGEPTWTDENGLVWVYTTNDDNEQEVMCLGRSASDGQEEQLGGTTPGEELRPDGPGDEGGDDAEGEDEGIEPGVVEAPGPEEGGPDLGAGGEGTGSLGDPGEEKQVSKKTVLAAAKSAGLSEEVVKLVEDAPDNGLSALLTSLGGEIKTLVPKAALGDKYVESLKADALAMYVQAHKDPEDLERPVSTQSFNKILDRCGDDVELLLDIINEQKAVAQAKFPGSVRRSTFPEDPNQPTTDLPDLPEDGNAGDNRQTRSVVSIHDR